MIRKLIKIRTWCVRRVRRGSFLKAPLFGASQKMKVTNKKENMFTGTQ